MITRKDMLTGVRLAYDDNKREVTLTPIKKKQPLVDPKSYEVAEYFLADFTGPDEAMIMQLAGELQYLIETFISDAERDGAIRETIDPDTAREDREERIALAREYGEYPDDD